MSKRPARNRRRYSSTSGFGMTLQAHANFLPSHMHVQESHGPRQAVRGGFKIPLPEQVPGRASGQDTPHQGPWGLDAEGRLSAAFKIKSCVLLAYVPVQSRRLRSRSQAIASHSRRCASLRVSISRRPVLQPCARRLRTSLLGEAAPCGASRRSQHACRVECSLEL